MSDSVVTKYRAGELARVLANIETVKQQLDLYFKGKVQVPFLVWESSEIKDIHGKDMLVDMGENLVFERMFVNGDATRDYNDVYYVMYLPAGRSLQVLQAWETFYEERETLLRSTLRELASYETVLAQKLQTEIEYCQAVYSTLNRVRSLALQGEGE